MELFRASKNIITSTSKFFKYILILCLLDLRAEAFSRKYILFLSGDIITRKRSEKHFKNLSQTRLKHSKQKQRGKAVISRKRVGNSCVKDSEMAKISWGSVWWGRHVGDFCGVVGEVSATRVREKG